MFEKEKLFAEPQPKLPPLTPTMLLVLRRVRAGDPFRDKKAGVVGRLQRLRELEYLRLRGYARRRGGLWEATKAGAKYLAAHPIR
jgi:hypothetical protein